MLVLATPKHPAHLPQGRKTQRQPHKTHTPDFPAALRASSRLIPRWLVPSLRLPPPPPLASQPSQLQAAAAGWELQQTRRGARKPFGERAPKLEKRLFFFFWPLQEKPSDPAPGFSSSTLPASCAGWIGNLRSPKPALPDPRSLRFLGRPDPEDLPPFSHPQRKSLHLFGWRLSQSGRAGKAKQGGSSSFFSSSRLPLCIEGWAASPSCFLSFRSLSHSFFLSFPSGFGGSKDFPPHGLPFCWRCCCCWKPQKGGEIAKKQSFSPHSQQFGK